MPDDFFAPPAFKSAEALLQLKRGIRELRPLAERGDSFELQGQRVIELHCGDTTVTARLAKRAARSPEFDTLVLKNAADVRKCVEEVKKRLARWSEE